MAIIVRHKATQKDYILLGGGFGYYQSKRPSPVFGNLIAQTDEGEYPMVCLCNPRGHIGWFYSDEVLVISVDGYPVSDIIE